MKHIALLALSASLPALAEVEGYDWETSNYVEIESKWLSEGDNVEMYDHNTNSYHDVEVQSIDRFGLTVEAEVYDYDTGEYRTIDLEK